MTITFNQAFGGSGGGASAVGGWSMAVTNSRSITFSQAGVLCMTGVGPGGSGAKASNGVGAATGGNSAPWGRKVLKISATDVLVISMGASGAAQATNNSNGNAGGSTTFTLNGVVVMTCPSGEGGVYAASSATAPTPIAAVTGAGLAVKGLAAGNVTGGAGNTSGGAAVDVLQSGLGRSPASSTLQGPGGSVGTDSGGNTFGSVIYADFGIVPGDGVTPRTAGRGGEVGGSGSVNGGAFAGGVGPGGTSGFGAGGAGGSVNPSLPGGASYAYLVFQPEE